MASVRSNPSSQSLSSPNSTSISSLFSRIVVVQLREHIARAEAKIRALSSIFSGKLEFDGKSFRTDSMNSVLALIYQQTNELRGLKNKSEESFSTFPASVPYDVLFSNEFLRDLSRLWSLRDIAPNPNNLPWVENFERL